MTSTDWERWAVCPNCRTKSRVAVAAGLELKKDPTWPCINCGAPLSLVDTEPDEDQPIGPPRAIDGTQMPFLRLVEMVRTNVKTTPNGEYTPVENVVAATLDALEGIGALPRGAVHR